MNHENSVTPATVSMSWTRTAPTAEHCSDRTHGGWVRPIGGNGAPTEIDAWTDSPGMAPPAFASANHRPSCRFRRLV